jgi:hypothetical protein
VPDLLEYKVKKAYLLADKKRKGLPLVFVSQGEIMVTVPDEAPDPINSVVVLDVNK